MLWKYKFYPLIDTRFYNQFSHRNSAIYIFCIIANNYVLLSEIWTILDRFDNLSHACGSHICQNKCKICYEKLCFGKYFLFSFYVEHWWKINVIMGIGNFIYYFLYFLFYWQLSINFLLYSTRYWTLNI